MRTLTVAAALLAAFLAGNAQAADNGFYLGAAVGKSTADVAGDLEPFFDDEDTSYKIIAGFRPLDWLAVEGNYIDLGAITQAQNIPDLSNFRAEETVFGVYGMLMWDIAMFDLYAKAGVVMWDANISGTIFGGDFDEGEDGTDFAWGVGAQVRLGSLAIRAEIDRFSIDNSEGLFEEPAMISLGLTWTFL